MKQLLLALMTVSLLAGCATERQQRATTTGAIIGATAGAVIGSQNGRAAQGAVIGGILGGLAGAVLAGDGSDEVYASGPAYHRRACPRGERYFVAARRARDPHRRVVLLRQGLRYCPDNPAAYNDLGVALVIIGEDDEARRHFRHALRLDPGYEPARRNLGDVERRMSRPRSEPRYQERPGNRQRGDRPHDRGRHEGMDRGNDRQDRRFDDRRDREND